MPSNNLLLIFVKHPVAGKAKTRLAATLGHEKALDIYRKLLAHTLQISTEVQADKVVFYGNEIPENDLWSEIGYPRHLQKGAGLGDRMKHAFAWGFDQGYEKIAIIGSDNARLSSGHLNEALQKLESHEAVIGPATDGGYYLLGMREMIEEVFEGKNWSTASVCADTLADFKKLGKTYGSLETLSDVDVEEDLRGTFLESYLS